MADYPLGSLGLHIKAHWKRHRPKMYAGLEESGHLAESLHAAQERTSDLAGWRHRPAARRRRTAPRCWSALPRCLSPARCCFGLE